MSTHRQLPNGEWTTSTRKYVKAWKAYNAAIESQLPRMRVYGFDPGVALCDAYGRGGGSVDLPRWAANRLAEAGGWKP